MTIGVASVIVLIAVGNGSSKAGPVAYSEPRNERAVVMPSGGFRGWRAGEHTSSVSLTKEDAQALQNPSLAPDVKSASPVVNASQRTARLQRLELRTFVVHRHHPLLI